MASPEESWTVGADSAAVNAAVDLFDRRQGFGDDDRLQVQLLTDPWSVWCWGFEPVRRTIQLRYPSIAFDVLVGGMFAELPDPKEHGFNLHHFFAAVSDQTGMPVGTGAVEGEDRPTSTYPACQYVHAVRLVDPDARSDYLRALREAVYLDGCNVSDVEVAVDVAEQVGVPADRVREVVELGDAERELHQRLEILDQIGLHAYPTLLFHDGERTAAVQGFQTLANVLDLAERLTDRVHPSEPAPDLVEIVPEGQRVATREVARVLDVSVEEAYDRLTEAAEAGRLQRERRPGGDVWTRPG